MKKVPFLRPLSSAIVRSSLDNSPHANLGTPSALGSISCLPVEIQLNIILELDISSLPVLCRVNSGAMVLVDGVSEWRKVRRPRLRATLSPILSQYLQVLAVF